MLTIPCAYQGGKGRIAKDIVDIIYNENKIDDNTIFYDLCCGSGAISIELVNRGLNPFNIVMVDKSPWGLFWKMIGETTFNMDIFRFWIDNIPKNVSKIQEYIKELSKTSAYSTQNDIAYIFLLLQASAFGSKSIWIENNKWQNTSFRSYWLPTKTSSRRSPVNPMMPMPETLYNRVQELSLGMKGVKGCWSDITNLEINSENAIIYIDPPYQGTTKYGFSFDYMSFINTYKNKYNIYLSEGKQISDNATTIAKERSKGGISGDRKSSNQEWLNKFIAY